MTKFSHVRGYEKGKSLDYCGGELVLFTKKQRWPNSYRAPAGEVDFRMYFVDDKTAIQITRLEELAEIATRRGADAKSSASKEVHGFAQMISDFMNWGLIVRPVERFAYLQARHGISLEEHRPRVVGNSLLFMAAKFDLSAESPHVTNVAIDLATFSATATEVMPQ